MTDVLDYEAEETDAPEPEAPSGLSRLLQFAEARGDITELLTEQELANLGHDVVEDYRRDDASRAEQWPKIQAALRDALPALNVLDLPLIKARATNVCDDVTSPIGYDTLLTAWVAK